MVYKMTRRKRDLSYVSHTKKNKSELNENAVTVSTPPRLVRAARGRLMGALLEVLEGDSDDEDEEATPSRSRRSRKTDAENDMRVERVQRQSYVLKLFDRSVDLSQFQEDSPLYPICRAWIANQPKADYSTFGADKEEPEETEDSIELPGPEGPPVSRIPRLLPEQLERDKDNINLNYREAPPPPRGTLLAGHLQRWGGVRRAWLSQAAAVEARYKATQEVLNKINMA